MLSAASFGLHLIRSGRLERELAGYLARSADDRLVADYDIEVTFGRDQATLECERAAAFLRRIREYLLKQGLSHILPFPQKFKEKVM